jgi:ammonia channel protein AmtB
MPVMEANNTMFWLLFGALLVFFMQAGFALLEAGSVRVKNTKSILLKVLRTQRRTIDLNFDLRNIL